MSESHTSVKTYFGIYAALLVLTGTTVGVAFLDFKAMNNVIAMAIAGGKAMLVLAYFMHLKGGSPITRFFLTIAFLWLLILIALTLGDVETRNWIPSPDSWLP